MDADSYTDRFFAIEARLGLFSEQSIGCYWWDAVRYDVYRYVYGQIANVKTPDPQRLTFLRRLRGWVERLALSTRLRLQIRLQKYDIILMRAPRQVREGRRRSDPAIDHLVKLCPGRVLVIDTDPHRYHLRVRRAHPTRTPCPDVVPRLAKALQAELGMKTGEAELRDLVVARLDDFFRTKAAYADLLTRVRPRLVVLTQNGIEKALFSAAHEAGCGVIEAQHGLIGHAHPAYSYSRAIDYRHLHSFPDIFLTFSGYWSRACHYPVRECIAIGNDAFHVPALPPPEGQGKVMFVSGDAYHVALVEWLRPLATGLPDRRFIYKLHPNQHRSHDAIRAELASLPNVEVVDSSVSAGSLLTTVSHVVVIVSTVALEALQAGRNVCVLPLMNYRVHPDLFGLDGVTVTQTLQALRHAVESTPGATERTRFFDPFDEGRATRLIQEQFRTGTTQPVSAVCP